MRVGQHSRIVKSRPLCSFHIHLCGSTLTLYIRREMCPYKRNPPTPAPTTQSNPPTTAFCASFASFHFAFTQSLADLYVPTLPPCRTPTVQQTHNLYTNTHTPTRGIIIYKYTQKLWVGWVGIYISGFCTQRWLLWLRK